MYKVTIDILQPFTKRDLAILQDWFKDVEAHKRLEGMLPLTEWYGHIEQHPSQMKMDIIPCGISQNKGITEKRWNGRMKLSWWMI